MGAGYHGGFGATSGASRMGIIKLDSFLVGDGHGKELAIAAKRVDKEPGFTDVAIHGSENAVTVFRKNPQGGDDIPILLDQRRLAKFLKHDKGYAGGKIRLLSCRTGNENGTFAQNLANKMGVVVRAPSDTLYIFPGGKMVIGPNAFTNTGRWIDYYPQKRKR